MEQTMGKRIAENRKRLGLTQDQLAEQLGVTAQAVSKWENDQSCPDIAMLPKLAEFFGISTDELLGRETHKVVHDAEVVDNDESQPEGFHVHNGKWEFQWNSGKRGAIAFALLVLLVGALTLADTILKWDASFWDILWPSALLVFGIDELIKKFSFFGLGCSLFGGYFLIKNLGIWELNIGGELVFPIIIVLFGLSLLVDALRKPKKPTFRVFHNGKNLGGSGSKETQSHFSTDEDSFACTLSFGEATRLISLPRLESGEVSCSFGELTVDLSGCEEIADGCEIEASCSFGELILLVPRRFRVEPDSSTSFASLSFQGNPDPNPQGIIRLDASISFGEIQIRYI